MEDEKTEAKRGRRRPFGPDGKTSLLYFDGATSLVEGDGITLSLFDTQRDVNDPDKTLVRYLKTRLEGAKALRDALDQAMSSLEGDPRER